MDHEHYRRMHGRSMPAMKPVAFEVILKDKQEIADGTVAFTFEKPEEFSFRAGQHVRMTLINPTVTDSQGNTRFFSLVNSPQEKDLVIAMRMRDTAFKKNMEHMQIGDKVRVETLLKSPPGAFAMLDNTSEPAVFLAGGIGVVPAFSMIKDALERKSPQPIYLFYSNRRPEDAPFLEELEELAKLNPNFKLIATMTEPKKSGNLWHGETGRIDRAMIERYVGDIEAPTYYIAGLSGMVHAMKTVLTDAGVSEGHIRAEEFSGFTMGHKDISGPQARTR